MGEPFIGEIKMAGFDYAPRNWALCDGQELQRKQNQVLFSLIGNTYGGDGVNTFRLPDFRGRVPVCAGDSYFPYQGLYGGYEAVPLDESQMPSHTHSFNALSTIANKGSGGKEKAAGTRLFAEEDSHDFYTAPNNLTEMSPNTSASEGKSLPHNNMQPSTVISFIIALDGIYPSRN